MRDSDQRFAERAKVVDVDLARPLPQLHGLDGYALAQCVVRAHGVPIGVAGVRLENGGCPPDALHAAVEGQLEIELLRFLVEETGQRTTPETLRQSPLHELFATPPRAYGGPWPSLTVAVCTRDRPADLAQCLDAVRRLDYPRLDVVVVDNAPSDDATERLVARGYRGVRYVREPRPGLDWARQRAVREATGEIIAFTDDDALVDPYWARALATAFASGGDSVMAVGGPVVAHELETPAQVYFERYGGFACGFARLKFRGESDWGVRGVWHYVRMAQHFTGANVAFRRRVFDAVGPFDPALDVGTPTNGGGDTEMLFRVLKAGFAIVYEPHALVRHRHRREYRHLRRQISGWGTGHYAFLTRTAIAYPEAWWVVGLIAIRGVWDNGVRLTRSLVHPVGFPRELLLTQLRGSLAGPFLYWRARRQAAVTARTFGPGLADEPR